MSKSLSTFEKKKLNLHKWRVYTPDSITQRAIADSILRYGESDSERTVSIFYSGMEYPCFIVPFSFVEFLVQNKDNGTYVFTIFHREDDDRKDIWRIWKESRKNRGTLLKAAFGDAIKKKTTPRQPSLFKKGPDKK